jgi:peptidoglycan/xylan/chitin deacetylase (PgdA/CDA1 family)
MCRFFAAAFSLALIAATSPVIAANCPGNPTAIGTERVMAVDPTQLRRVGTMQYPGTLPLRDHELVLTFDDGPLSPYTGRILSTLRAECVRATFFVVGSMAKANPNAVRRAYAEGHTIATHSQRHRVLGLNVQEAGAEQDFDSGVEIVAAVLGGRNAVAPFYRFPGLGRSNAAEQYLHARGVMAWSADFVADDWTHISAQKITARVLARIERKGRGILVLHDIQPATARALPGLLRELKARHFHIVHVVPAASAAAVGRPVH